MLNWVKFVKTKLYLFIYLVVSRGIYVVLIKLSKML
jgi:hypothetical protein